MVKLSTFAMFLCKVNLSHSQKMFTLTEADSYCNWILKSRSPVFLCKRLFWTYMETDKDYLSMNNKLICEKSILQGEINSCWIQNIEMKVSMFAFSFVYTFVSIYIAWFVSWGNGCIFKTYAAYCNSPNYLDPNLKAF